MRLPPWSGRFVPLAALTSRRIAALVVWAILALPGAARAETLRELVSEALANNPEIVAAQKRYEASRQRPSQASSLPDPMVSPGYSSNGRPWPGAGLGTEPTSQIGVMVSQEIPFPGKRKLAGEMAVKEAEAEWHQYQQVQLNVVSRLKQAYYRRAYAFAAVDVVDKNLHSKTSRMRSAPEPTFCPTSSEH
ncbi:MAG: TolC family protein, partial [Nitrospirota bacterium]